MENGSFKIGFIGVLLWWLFTVVKSLPANARDAIDVASIPGSRRSSRGGNSNLLQYFCLVNPLDSSAWQAIVYGLADTTERLNNNKNP